MEFFVRGLNVNYGDNAERLRETHNVHCGEIVNFLKEYPRAEGEDIIEELCFGDCVLVCKQNSVLDELLLAQRSD